MYQVVTATLLSFTIKDQKTFPFDPRFDRLNRSQKKSKFKCQLE